MDIRCQNNHLKYVREASTADAADLMKLGDNVDPKLP